MMFLTWFLLAALGASWGSFLNAVGRRLLKKYYDQSCFERGTGLGLGDRSCCFCCSRQLRIWDLIPVVSFCVFRGRSRCCGANLPYGYLLSEVYFLCLLPLLFSINEDSIFTLSHMILFSVMYILVISDILYFSVPIFLLSIPIFLLPLDVLGGYVGALPEVSIGFGIGFFMLYLPGLLTSYFSGRSSLGGADPIIFGALAARLEFLSLPYLLLLSSLTGIFWAWILGRQKRIPFIPSIFISFNIVYFFEYLYAY